MHASMTYFIYSSNNLTLESIISQKYTNVPKTSEVISSRIHGSNSKCIVANKTANTQLLFLLRKHTNTQLGSLLQSIQNIYKRNQTQVYPFLYKFGILMLKTRTPSTSLICLFKLNCNYDTEWSCNRK